MTKRHLRREPQEMLDEAIAFEELRHSLVMKRRELPNWQGREVRNHMTGQIVEGKALERYLVEWIW